MPADGMSAAARKGTSAHPAGSSQIRLHRLSVREEGGAPYHRAPRSNGFASHEAIALRRRRAPGRADAFGKPRYLYEGFGGSPAGCPVAQAIVVDVVVAVARHRPAVARGPSGGISRDRRSRHENGGTSARRIQSVSIIGDLWSFVP